LLTAGSALSSFFFFQATSNQPDDGQRKRDRKHDAEHAREEGALSTATGPKIFQILDAVAEVAIHEKAGNNPRDEIARDDDCEIERGKSKSRRHVFFAEQCYWDQLSAAFAGRDCAGFGMAAVERKSASG
jgi:hypothetical protein